LLGAHQIASFPRGEEAFFLGNRWFLKKNLDYFLYSLIVPPIYNFVDNLITSANSFRYAGGNLCRKSCLLKILR
jgi:hypothetical protein